MIEKILLQTPMARDIARKGLGRLAGGASAGTPLLVDLLQQYSMVDYDITGHSAYGSEVEYFAFANDPPYPPGDRFPTSSSKMVRYWDFSEIEYLKLIANITKVGPPGSELLLVMSQYIGGERTDPANYPLIPFEVEAPSVPADSLGLHVSEWRRVLWLEEEADNLIYGRPAETTPYLTNPDELSGTIGAGLIQILVKGV